ncbi:MAG: Mrp/NBP35 family ATP-binding protein [Archaeoglobales archaeon]|nr:Mrp/NBP35 family ATP-binding protein [Archaeoglobales archaeon]
MEDRRKLMEEQDKRIKERMGKIKHKIAVISGKGGVGKSTVTVNLAMAFAMKGYSVGILDADVHGPSVPKMLGLKGRRLQVSEKGDEIIPVLGPMNIKVVSMDFLLPADEAPVVWRGPLKISAIRQLLGEVGWGELDYLLIDLPPGTGDEPLSIAQLLPDMDGVIIVTIPSEVSEQVVKKSVKFAELLKMRIIGIVENMSYLSCPKCGERIEVFNGGAGKRIAKSFRIPLLGEIPMDPKIAKEADSGMPFVVDFSSKTAKAFEEIVNRIENVLGG